MHFSTDMKFRSTGGRVRDVSFEEAVFTGFDVDGGVLMPEEIEAFSPEDIEEMRKMSYVGVVKKVVSKFVSSSEIPPSVLSGEAQFEG